MNAVLEFLVDNWTAILSGAGSAVGLFVGCYAAAVTRHLRKRFKAASDRGTYVICPHCKKAVKLSDVVTFYLPDGTIDNDLDGKPDKD